MAAGTDKVRWRGSGTRGFFGPDFQLGLRIGGKTGALAGTIAGTIMNTSLKLLTKGASQTMRWATDETTKNEELVARANATNSRAIEARNPYDPSTKRKRLFGEFALDVRSRASQQPQTESSPQEHPLDVDTTDPQETGDSISERTTGRRRVGGSFELP